MKSVYPIFDIKAEHGESPVWDNETGAFYWVDLLKGHFHKSTFSNNSTTRFSVGQPLGVVALREKGGYVMGLQQGFAFFDERTHSITPISDPEADLPANRFNDGAVDPAGRFLSGTMNFNGSEPVGSLYSLQTNLSVSKIETDIYVTNGMDWHPDGNSFFLTDTNRHIIYKYDYDAETGVIFNRSNFIVFKDHEFPDGMCIDMEGNLWIASWGAAKICRYNEDGVKIEDIGMPVEYPTSCCFGGDDL
ncbi:MAG: SMP-30/gluconolactonase/LRE family protein, partial [Bacteroidetes bacterium]|nr:SMP-30/gluconolactonase/LRE family protein [Bacteroidota bacterium]